MCLKTRWFPSNKAKRVFPKNSGRGGLWVWKTPAEVPPQKLLAGARSLGAQVLYLNIYPLSGQTLNWLEEVMVAAIKQGLRIELLCGASGWINESARSFLRTSIINPLLRLQERLRLGGIDQPLPVHLDVEPHSDGPMDEGRMAAYLDLLKWMRDSLGRTELAVDAPVWYSTLRLKGQPFSHALLQRVDSATLMAYGRSVKAVVEESASWLEAASGLNKKITVAIERGNQGPVRLKTPRQVSSAVKAIARGLRRQPGFAACLGIAVHHLDLMSGPESTPSV